MELISAASLIGTFLTLIGVILTYYQIRKVRKEQRFEKIRRTFSSVCKMPATEVATYGEVYKELFSHYNLDNKKTSNDIIYINRSYFNRTVLSHYVNQVDMDSKEIQYKFPLICKNHWLKSNYNDLIIEKDGPLKFQQVEEIKHILDSPANEFLKCLQMESYPAFLASTGKQIWNAKTFDISSIEDKNKTLKLSFILGCYFNYVQYYDLISKELYFHLYTSGNKEYSGRSLIKQLPRKYILRDSVSIDEIFDFKNRPVKLGINIFVLMKKKDENKYCTFIQKRGNSQVEYPGFYHVAPAGTFQPLSEFDRDIIQRQCEFQYTVLRELLEEVYDLEKADRNKDVDPFDIFRIEKRKDFRPGLSLLTENEIEEGIPLSNDKYEIIPTGFLIDLVTLKPELTVILHIKDSAVYASSKKNIEGNWEGSVKEFDIESDEFIRFLNQNLNIDNFLPAGAVALAEGLNFHFKKL